MKGYPFCRAGRPVDRRERKMKKKRSDITVCVLLNVIAVLTAAFLYLIYRNWLAEDMIRELNRDYEEMVKSAQKPEADKNR